MALIPNWHVTGDWFDVCRCNIPCPCEFAQAPAEAQFAELIGEIRGLEFAPIEFELAPDLANWRARIPGKVEASAVDWSGPART